MLDLRAIEQALDNLQRLRSVTASVALRPGPAPGERLLSPAAKIVFANWSAGLIMAPPTTTAAIAPGLCWRWITPPR
ncbi:hypothetical protein SODG_002235 [Sodalis praecaptivus]